MIKAIFFDATDTLFRITHTVGWHYAVVAQQLGLVLEAGALDRAFHASWKRVPPRTPTGTAREDDDKGWWRELVDDVLNQVAPELHELDRDNFFEVAYEHFAEAGVWELFPETVTVLEELAPRFPLAVVSNFDGRLRLVLEQLGISRLFCHVFISSELGYDKPDPQIFRRATELIALAPADVLHVGDDRERDWRAARAAGLQVFELHRPETSLLDVVAATRNAPACDRQ